MTVIGLTGGVGSGKSFVADMIHQKMNAILLITDKIGAKFMEPGERCYDDIMREFNTIDKKELFDIIFMNPKKKALLEKIIHTAVIDYIEDVIEEHEDEEGIIVIESAILFESGLNEMCDEVWFVYVDEKTRRDRLKASRGYSDEKIDKIEEAQKSDDFYLTNSKVIINNSFSRKETEVDLDRIFYNYP